MRETDTPTVAFVCVRNAGRSQMAYAFARRELARRDLEGDISLVTGGTQPADRVHPEVIEVMQDVGIDLTERTPREVTVEELRGSVCTVTMGCSASDVCPAGWGGEHREWDLDDPHGRTVAEVVEIREEIRRRVDELFEERLPSG